MQFLLSSSITKYCVIIKYLRVLGSNFTENHEFCSVSNIIIIVTFFFYEGSVLSAGGSGPAKHASAKRWIKMVNEFQKGSLSTRLGIPMIYGIDAVHGNNNVYKATIFPHNIGLGATRQVDSSITNMLENVLGLPLS